MEKNPEFYRLSLGITQALLSAETLRQRMDDIGRSLRKEILQATIDKNGQIMLAPDIELNTWWTNLGMSDDEIIRLYYAHGECEQYHSEIKSDTDVSGSRPENS